MKPPAAATISPRIQAGNVFVSHRSRGESRVIPGAISMKGLDHKPRPIPGRAERGFGYLRHAGQPGAGSSAGVTVPIPVPKHRIPGGARVLLMSTACKPGPISSLSPNTSYDSHRAGDTRRHPARCVGDESRSRTISVRLLAKESSFPSCRCQWC